MRRYLYHILFSFLALLVSIDASATFRDDLSKRPLASDSLLRNVFQFAPFYSKIIDEYSADLYIKGGLHVHKRNYLLRYVPSMFRFEKGINDYIIESISEIHYTAPNTYDRKIKAMSSTFRRDRGQITDMAEFLNINVYSPSLMSDRLISPLDSSARKYYTYVLDSVAGPPDSLKYKIGVIPTFRSPQLVTGYFWVSDQVWTVRNFYFEGSYDVIDFKIDLFMGDSGNEEFLPVKMNMDLTFKFLGNHLEMNNEVWLKYKDIRFYEDAKEARRSLNKHSHDLTESYNLTLDSTRLMTDKLRFSQLRPFPLSAKEDSIYAAFQVRRDTTRRKKKKKENKTLVFLGSMGDALISSYNLDLDKLGNVKCSPLINPVLLSYSPRRGISYKQRFKYNRYSPKSQRLLRITPQFGYNFTHKELYMSMDASFQYYPQKQGAFEMKVGNGNRIYSSAVVDQLKNLVDTVIDFKKMHLDYFKDVYFDFFHTLEVINGLKIKAGVSIHWRKLLDKGRLDMVNSLPGYKAPIQTLIRSTYNSFAPRLCIEWTPGMYYYMNGKRKMNVGSSLPTFILDYERGIKNVFGSTGEHERWELDIQQKVKLSRIRSIGYRLGGGLFTNKDNFYFVDFARFRRNNLPEGWNDEIGGTFQLLERYWYNASRGYLRGNFTYESPFILLKRINHWLGVIQQERFYGGVLVTPHLKPYVELGYGFGTHVFDVGFFVSSMNYKFDACGFKFTFELFND